MQRAVELGSVIPLGRATASKIPVILAVLDGNLICSYNVYYWHIFNNHPNYGCKSLEYSQKFRSITVSGLPYLMKNPHFDAVALSPSGSPDSPRLFFFSALRFHGKNGWMSLGTLPPAAAQCSKYHVSHFRGLSFHSANVAKIENNAAISCPLQSDPEP